MHVLFFFLLSFFLYVFFSFCVSFSLSLKHLSSLETNFFFFDQKSSKNTSTKINLKKCRHFSFKNPKKKKKSETINLFFFPKCRQIILLQTTTILILIILQQLLSLELLVSCVSLIVMITQSLQHAITLFVLAV